MCKTRMVFLLVFLMLSSACSTVKIPMVVTHPAEIDMSAYKQVAVSKITGSLGEAFSDSLKETLVNSGRFKIVDRNRIDSVMKELKLSQSNIADKNNRVESGKFLIASAIITGHTSGKYKENSSRYRDTCTRYDDDGNKHKYSCTRYKREGRYNTSGSVDIIDVKTGEIIRSKRLDADNKKTTSATDKTPAVIDKDKLAASCVAKNVGIFAKSIAPWKETIEVAFEKDSDIPDLERGIVQVRIGENKEALSIFSAAIKKAERNVNISPKTISKAYWDIGLLYEYTWKFDIPGR